MSAAAAARRPEASARLRRTLVAATAVGLLLRLGVCFFPKFTTGDELWYAGVAAKLVHGLPTFTDADAFGRPPGMPFWIAWIFALFGTESVVPVRVVNAIVSATTPWLAARAARALFPRQRTTLPLAAAWIQALNPLDVKTVQWVMTENLVTPLTLFGIVLALRTARRARLRDAAILGVVAGLLQYLRMDSFLLSAGLVGGAALLRLRRRGLRAIGSAIRPAAAAAGVAVLLCVPWSAFVSARLGRPVFLCDAKAYPPFLERAGWLRWISNSYLPRKDWLRIFWWGPKDVDLAWVPDSVWASDAERRECLALMERTRAAGRLLPEVDAEFDRIGQARRRADPLRYHVVLPALRTANVWFDPMDDDQPRHMDPVRRSAPSWALEAALRVARPVAGLGFVVALALFFVPSVPAFVAAAVIVSRTVGLYFMFPLATGYGIHEGRYVATVQPLALILLAAVVGAVLARRRRPEA